MVKQNCSCKQCHVIPTLFATSSLIGSAASRSANHRLALNADAIAGVCGKRWRERAEKSAKNVITVD
jgi:hypothetical protein